MAGATVRRACVRARDRGWMFPEMILGLIDGPADNKVQRCIIHQVIETKRLDVSMSPEDRRQRHGAPTTKCPGGGRDRAFDAVLVKLHESKYNISVAFVL